MVRLMHRLSFVALLTAIGAVTPLAAQGLGAPGRATGTGLSVPVTGATATRPAVLVTVPPRQEFPALKSDPIERAEFLNNPHPIKKSITTAYAMMIQDLPDGSMIGSASDVIATVPADSRRPGVSAAVFVSKHADVGQEMKTSFDEAVRAVKLRYPRWEPGRIEFSFGEKYTEHDGGSAGTCFGVMLLSMLEGFELDDKFAVTGDITVNWKVRKVSGVADKVRGAAADGRLFAAIPADNAPHLADMALMYGESSLLNIQVFSIETLQDAVALMRKDRAPQIAQAVKEFAELQPRLKTLGAEGLKNPSVQSALEQVVAYAPNHQSARWLLEIGRETAPRTFSTSFALDQVFVITYPYRFIIMGMQEPTRETVSSAMTAAARRQLAQLRPRSPRDLQALMTTVSAIIETSETVAASPPNRRPLPTVMESRRQAFRDQIKALVSDKQVLEALLRE